jgi:hypothetical protein
MSDKAVNTLGLVFNLLGVFILFRYGMPFHIPTGGANTLLLEGTDQAAVALEHKYMLLGYVGLAFLVLGTVLQIIATWMPSKDC